jgi:hypothetical protein
MAVITPQTDLYLLKCPLEISDINQLTFANATAQYNYFSSLPKIGVDNFTYQRKDDTIRYGANFDSLVEYNYVMYRNDAYSSKWFYAYITGMEYLNDNVTAISIKTDPFQTWQFNLSYKPCLIDREHTNNDTVGANTLPEGLELGEMICNGAVQNFGDGSNRCVVVEVSMIENEGDGQTLSYSWASGAHNPQPRINGIDRGTIPLVVGMEDGWQNTPSYVTNFYDRAGLSDAIVNVYMIPKSLVGNYNRLTLTLTKGSSSRSIDQLVIPESTSNTTSMGTFTFARPTTIRNFTPVNKKLLTYPYNYFNLSNNAGTCQPFRYEDFQGNISFRVEGTFGISANTKAIPLDYKYVDTTENALDYSVTGAKYPVCSWKSDSYTNWLTQNSINMTHQWNQSIFQGGWNALSGGVAAGVTTANPLIGLGATAALYAGDLIGTALQQHRAKSQANLEADQVSGNASAGDIVWSKYRSPFTFMPMSIKPEVARCIDEFFSQFGYKCNRVKVPNITGRRNWNYVKTVGCYIAGNVPQEDMAEIKAMFDKGITLWHNPATFADYSQNNDII